MNIQISKKSRCLKLEAFCGMVATHNCLSRCPNQMSDVRTYFGHLALKPGFTWPNRQMSDRCPKVKMIQTSGNWKVTSSQDWQGQIQMSEALKNFLQKIQMSDPLILYLQYFDP